MARSSAVQVDNAFVGGLNTDFTALNFPENSCTVTQNCVFEPSGRVERRLGMDFEDNYSVKDITKSEDIVTSYLWKEVNGNGNVNLFVVQVGATLHFYETTATSISQGAIVSTVDISTYAVESATDINRRPCQYAHGRGLLFVTHENCDPFYVSYIANTIDSERITVKIRDFAGLDDELDIDERPAVNLVGLTKEHEYNLYNQGWQFNSIAALTAWDTARADLPSNADVWWYYKDADDAFDPTTIANRDPGLTPAPRGHFIVDAFDIDRSTVSGVSDIPVESTDPYRPRVVAFFAGRVWYGGTSSANTLNRLYFSQVIETTDQLGNCYQVNDPTSELLFDLLPTDGGTLEVSGAGTIYKLFPYGNALLVFASNGVWAIAGSQGLGFVANDFSVTKISAVETDSSTSFVSAEGTPFWWTGEAICTVITQDNVTFQVQKVSDTKIREFFLLIPAICKQQAVGAFNPSSRIIHWLYRSTEPNTVQEITEYDRILAYNLLTQAFYIHTFDGSHPTKIHSIEMFKGFAGESEALTVLAGEDEVVTSAGDDVVVFDIQGNTSVPVFKYYVSYIDEDSGNSRFTFAEMRSPTYVDWDNHPDAEPVEYLSEFITGYKIHTNTQRFFQANYIFVFLEERLQDSSCFMQAVWDYAESGDTGKWSSKQQLYNPDLLNRGVNFRRLKIRGKGRALQLRFTSDGQQPFTIIGWSIFETANNDL